MKKITQKQIDSFKRYLINEEKSEATIAKYVHDVRVFVSWVEDEEIDKTKVLSYKNELTEKYAPASVNAALASLNCFFRFCGQNELCVKTIKIQRQIFAQQEKELTKNEYERLLKAAKEKGNERLYMLMQTICSTGIRISELRFITVDAVRTEKAVISCKGKTRIVFLPAKLCKMLKKYIKERNIQSGSVFVSKNGKPLDRSNIWADMKKLCQSAGVSKNKVFPHNLRHLFARTYYSLEKDIIRLADILGHSSVNTTRIYTMECGNEHRRQIQRLGLLRC